MKKYFLTTILLLILANSVFASEWREGSGEQTLLGSETVSDIDTAIFQNMTEPLDRLLTGYRTVTLLHNSGSTLQTSVTGSVVCANAGGTIKRFRYNPASINITFSDLDTGAEASNTTYYVYAVCDATADTFTAKISANSSTPSGVTYFLRLGSFLNDGSSNITVLSNDDERFIMATGTIANGGTISLPSGWAQDECNWMVAHGSANPSGSHPDGVYHNATVDSSRVATCTTSKINAGGSGSVGTTICNYMIACYR